MVHFFHEDFQNRRISEAEIKASQAASNAADTREKIQSLEKRIDRLVLLNRVLWSVLQEQTGMTEADLVERLEGLTEVVTEARKATARTCPRCQRTMHPKQSRCLYCGTQRTYDSVFDQF